MTRYQGADGWMYEEGRDKPRRYQQSDNLEPTKPVEKAENEVLIASGCIGVMALTIAVPLILTGLGYWYAGFGGMLMGFGIAVVLLVAVGIGLAVFMSKGDGAS